MLTSASRTPKNRLAPYLHRVKETPLLEKRGHVTQLIGLVIESAGPMCAVGDVCRIEPTSGDAILAEVVGFRGDCVLLMPLREVHAYSLSDVIRVEQATAKGKSPS